MLQGRRCPGVVTLVGRVRILRQEGELVVGPGTQRQDPSLGEGRDRAGSVRLGGVDARVWLTSATVNQRPTTRTITVASTTGHVPGAVEPLAQPSLRQNEDDEEGDEGHGHDRTRNGDTPRLIVCEPPALGPVDIGRRRQNRGAHEVIRLGEVGRRQRVGRQAFVEVGVLDDAGVDGQIRRERLQARSNGRIRAGLPRCLGHVGRGPSEIALVAALERGRLDPCPCRNEAAAVVSASDKEVSTAWAVTISGSACCQADDVADCLCVVASAATSPVSSASSAMATAANLSRTGVARRAKSSWALGRRVARLSGAVIVTSSLPALLHIFSWTFTTRRPTIPPQRGGRHIS